MYSRKQRVQFNDLPEWIRQVLHHESQARNPNWGRPIAPVAARATEFELRGSQLRLITEKYASSPALRAWYEHDTNRCYVSLLLFLTRFGFPLRKRQRGSKILPKYFPSLATRVCKFD